MSKTKSRSRKNRPPKAAKRRITPPTRKTGPVARAWAIFGKLPRGTRRRDAIAMCIKARINKYTAATQYQLWLHRNDK